MIISSRSRSIGLAVKCLADVVVAAVLAVLLSPLLFICAVALVVDSPGPVFFRQRRLGRDGRLFRVFKFRTMVVDAEKLGTGILTCEGDPRVTRIGHIMRKYRIDEIPQLLNVLCGEMSLVGPRPLVPDYFDHWSDHDRRRLLMLPGITGWQQINGGERNTWQQRMELDVWYVEHWSLWLDLRILLRTPWVVMRADTAHDKDGWKRSAIPPGADLDGAGVPANKQGLSE